MTTTAQKSNHITNVRQAATALLDAYNRLSALRREWDALALSSELAEGDFSGQNAELLPADIAAIYTTLGALDTLMAAGNSTNLHKVKVG